MEITSPIRARMWHSPFSGEVARPERGATQPDAAECTQERGVAVGEHAAAGAHQPEARPARRARLIPTIGGWWTIPCPGAEPKESGGPVSQDAHRRSRRASNRRRRGAVTQSLARCPGAGRPWNPWNAASPKSKTPPSDAGQPVAPHSAAAIPTTGALSCRPPMEPARASQVEDPAVRSHQPVSVAIGGGGHADDRRIEALPAHRPVEPARHRRRRHRRRPPPTSTPRRPAWPPCRPPAR